MFGVIPKALWSRMIQADEENRIAMQTNCVLLESGDRRVLIETGFGNKFGTKDRTIFAMEARWIDDALREIDVERESITDVILTHLHFDHAGGLTYFAEGSERPLSSFPKARIHIQRTEWEDALANRSTMTKTYLREHLDPIASQLHLLDGYATPLEGIEVRPVPGHTWGQQAILFRDHDGLLCFPGDLLPTAHHLGDAFNMAYDMLPYQNTQTKKALIKQAHQEGWRLILDHDADTPLVEIRQDERKRFSLHPIPFIFSTPQEHT